MLTYLAFAAGITCTVAGTISAVFNILVTETLPVETMLGCTGTQPFHCFQNCLVIQTRGFTYPAQSCCVVAKGFYFGWFWRKIAAITRKFGRHLFIQNLASIFVITFWSCFSLFQIVLCLPCHHFSNPFTILVLKASILFFL